MGRLWLRTACIGLAFAGMPLPAPAEGASCRVAVIAAAGADDLAALVTAGLSSAPGIALVERDDLAKIGDEQAVREMAAGKPADLGRLLRADGLLFLRPGKPGSRETEARFTAVGLGWVLFDVALDSRGDPAQLADLLGGRVAALGPKLKLSPADATALSVLSLKAELGTYQTAADERRLTLLLERQLATVPGLVVLERRHAGSLALERDLSSEPTDGPLTGLWWIDGSLRFPSVPDGKIEATLRLRSSRSQEPLSLSVQGPPGDLPALADAMAKKIAQAVGEKAEPGPSRPSAGEARQYLLEGIWAQQHGEPQAALEALDSAELLGETAPDLPAVRALTQADLALKGTLEASNGNIMPDDPRPDERADRVLDAMQAETRFEQAGGNAALATDGARRGSSQAQCRSRVEFAAGKVLWMLDRLGSGRADAVRAALRPFLGYDPLNGRIPGNSTVANWFVDDLSVSPEEETAYARAVWTRLPSASWEGRGLEYDLLSVKPIWFLQRFVPDEAVRRERLLGFARDLARDPVGRPHGLLLQCAAADPGPARTAAYAAFCDDLSAEKESLAAQRRLFDLLAWACELRPDTKTPLEAGLVETFRHSLQHAPDWDGAVHRMWHPELFPAEAAPLLWKDLEDYKGRCPANAASFGDLEASYVSHFGDPSANTKPLVVSRLWSPWTGASTAPRGTYFSLQYAADPRGGLFAVGSYPAEDGKETHNVATAYRIDLETFAGDELHPPADALGKLHAGVRVGGDFVYALGAGPAQDGKPGERRVWRYQISTGKWEVRDVPGATTLYPLGDRLYFNERSQESAIVRVDWDAGQNVVLTSSRRNPPHNQFDGLGHFNVDAIFAGPGGQPCAVIGDIPYLVQEQDGDWKPLTLAAFWYQTSQDGDRTAFFAKTKTPDGSRQDTVIVVDPKKPAPELWLGAAEAVRPGSPKAVPGSPLADLPDWAKVPPLWPAGALQGTANGSGVYFLRGDDLYALSKGGTVSHRYTLYRLRRGETRPTQIPLQFVLDDATRATLVTGLGEYANTIQEIASPETNAAGLELVVAKEGICLANFRTGFWFLPFSDLDAYLQTASSP